jgi:CubicO group peptidase (beta-lactamase class C family)
MNCNQPFIRIKSPIMRKLLLLLLLPLNLFAQDQQLEKFIDSLVGPFNKAGAPGSMILVVQDGKQLVKKAYGMANLELSVPLRTDHAFAIGSVTKQFTAVAILQLVQNGKLSLSDDIRKYIPFFDTHGKTITIENLLTHTSGISGNLTELRQESGIDTYSDNFLRYIMKFPLDFDPGTDWSYSNNGFRVAAIIVERVSGQSWAAYIKEHLFDPAGMHDTYVADDLQTMNNLVSSYIRGVNGIWRNASTLRPEWNWAKGAGNIISTLDDMYRWNTSLLAGKIVAPELLEKAWTSYKLKNGTLTNYGYGFNITSHENFRVIHHNGGIYGYRNIAVYVPEKKLYVQYVNLYSGDYTLVSKKVIGRLLQIAPPATDGKYAVNPADYAGDYEQHYVDAVVSTHSRIPVYESVLVKGDSIYLQEKMSAPVLLKPIGKDKFIAGRPEDGYYVFNRDKNDKVISIRLQPYLYGVGNSGVENKKITIVHQSIPQTVIVSTGLLKNYTGTYYRPETATYLFVELQGNRLFANTLGATQKYELVPVADNKFIRKGQEEFSLSFSPDDKGIMKITASGFTQFDYKKIAD